MTEYHRIVAASEAALCRLLCVLCRCGEPNLPRARLLLLDPRHPLAACELGGDVGGGEAGVGPDYEEVVEHVGAFEDERGAVAAGGFDDRLDRFLAEFLRDLFAAFGEEAGGV